MWWWLLNPHCCCTPEVSDNRQFLLMSLKGLKSHRTKWHFSATFKCLLNSKQSAAKNTPMILEMGSAEQFSPTDSKRSENHAELQTPCACVCACVCIPTCLGIAVFRDRLNLVYWDGNCKHNTHHYPINTHTGCCNCLSFMCAVCREAGMETDVIMTQRWSGYFSIQHQLSSQGLATHIQPASSSHDRPLLTHLFLSCQQSVNSKRKWTAQLSDKGHFSFNVKMGSSGRKQMLRFSAGLTEAKSDLIVILWDISGHSVWKRAVFKM